MRRTAQFMRMGSLIIGGVALAGDAFALQPLEQFVAAAQAQSTDVVEARATAEQHEAESKQAWLKLAPNFTAKGTYAHNQYSGDIPAGSFGPGSPAIVIIPKDEVDAYFTVTLPVIDVGSWLRIGGASATAEAGKLRAGASQLEIAKSTTRLYYQIVADAAAIDAAKRAQGASEDNLKVVRDRLTAGTASELDVERARAEVERAKQTLASAEVAYISARRAMETASGMRPAEGAMPALTDGLTPEELSARRARARHRLAARRPCGAPRDEERRARRAERLRRARADRDRERHGAPHERDELLRAERELPAPRDRAVDARRLRLLRREGERRRARRGRRA